MKIKTLALAFSYSILLSGCISGSGSSTGSSAEASEPVSATQGETTPEVETTCTLTSMPYYGPANLRPGSEVIYAYPLDSSNNQTFSISMQGDNYGFFAYPAALGEATFFDKDLLNIEGGWDGATWTPYAFDPEVHTTYEPIVITIDDTDWFVYRTDFYGTGERNFDVVFDNAGLELGDTVACDLSSFTRKSSSDAGFDIEASIVVSDSPQENTPDPVDDGTCTVSALPRVGTYTKNIGLASEVDNLIGELGTTNNQSFTLDLTDASDFGFFAYPAALGEATFVDTSLNIPGGWDGATWTQEWWTATKNTPIVIHKDNTKWFVYRTDFAGIGNRTFNVTFANAGASVGSTVDCDLSTFPVVSTGSVEGDEDLSIVYVYNQGDFTTPVAEGIVTNGGFEINTTHLSDGNYSIYFATASSDGLVYGDSIVGISNGTLTTTDFDVTVLSVISN